MYYNFMNTISFELAGHFAVSVEDALEDDK